MFLFNKKSNDQDKITELFTYFIPNPPIRSKGYREKELDLIANLFSTYKVDFEIKSTVNCETGFWTLFVLKAPSAKLKELRNSAEYQEHKLSSSQEEDEIELISEGDNEFSNLENFKL
ncbi:MAG: hypothetical protein BM556_14590 [Bacteriovorax sp. MedPE-SWde]|nr:MAG: hypothetical protein BM556_14590 [Bacteriovorax sp. MedPE-SWde]